MVGSHDRDPACDRQLPLLRNSAHAKPREVRHRDLSANDAHISSSCTAHATIPNLLSYTTRTPAGVALLISPWNLPLYLLTWKIAPCLAFGCTCVCKPSEFTSLTAGMLAQVFVDAGRRFYVECLGRQDARSCRVSRRSSSVHMRCLSSNVSSSTMFVHDAFVSVIITSGRCCVRCSRRGMCSVDSAKRRLCGVRL